MRNCQTLIFRFFVLFFACLPTLLCARLAHVREFDAAVTLISSQLEIAADNDFEPTTIMVDTIRQIHDITEISVGYRNIKVDFKWAIRAIEEIGVMESIRQRHMSLVYLVDTLTEIREELQRQHQPKYTKEQMKRALEKTIEHTAIVRLSGQSKDDKRIEYLGRGGYAVLLREDVIYFTAARGQTSSRPLPTGKTPISTPRTVRRPTTTQPVTTSTHTSSGSSRHVSTTQTSSSEDSAPQAESSHTTVPSTTSQTSQRRQDPQLTPTPKQTHQTQTSKTQPTQTQPTQTQPTQTQPTQTQPTRTRQAQTTETSPPEPRKAPEEKKPLSESLFYVLLVVFSIVFIILAIIYARSTSKKILEEKEKAEISEKELPPEKLKKETLYDMAMQAAASGNYYEAIRLLTIGALILLEHKSVINYQDTLTNGEYLKELLVKRELYTMFKKPMQLFDKLIYGFEKPDKKDFELFQRFYLKLEKINR